MNALVNFAFQTQSLETQFSNKLCLLLQKPKKHIIKLIYSNKTITEIINNDGKNAFELSDTGSHLSVFIFPNIVLSSPTVIVYGLENEEDVDISIVELSSQSCLKYTTGRKPDTLALIELTASS